MKENINENLINSVVQTIDRSESSPTRPSGSKRLNDDVLNEASLKPPNWFGPNPWWRPSGPRVIPSPRPVHPPGYDPAWKPKPGFEKPWNVDNPWDPDSWAHEHYPPWDPRNPSYHNPNWPTPRDNNPKSSTSRSASNNNSSGKDGLGYEYDPWAIPDWDDDGIIDTLDKDNPNYDDQDGDGLPDYADPIINPPPGVDTDGWMDDDDGDGILNWEDDVFNYPDDPDAEPLPPPPPPWDTNDDGIPDLLDPKNEPNTTRSMYPHSPNTPPGPGRDTITPLSVPTNTNPFIPPGFGAPPRPFIPTSNPTIPDVLSPPSPPSVLPPPNFVRPVAPNDFRIGTDGSRVNPRHAGSKSAYLGNQANPRKGFMHHWKSAKSAGKQKGTNGILPISFGKVSASQAYNSSDTNVIGAGGAPNIAINESHETVKYGKARKLISEAIKNNRNKT